MACRSWSPWWSVAAVVVCMIGMYVIFPLNYALALVAITPMALLAVGTSADSVAALTADRLSDTVIGALAAVAVTWGTSWFFPRRLVRAQSRRAEAAIAAVRRTNAAGAASAPKGRRALVELRYELIHHLIVLDRPTTPACPTSPPPSTCSPDWATRPSAAPGAATPRHSPSLPTAGPPACQD
ncbi:FUSC family protein [Streptomyces sp. NBC_01220]|uniref:FUSC family protein n=1 Tax=Streptomyces sp. NBC_01220 TaxID=2903781 RepID=UPI00352F9319|nr:FUSC family protein [Streptomyces sp. NBC_01220]